LLTFDGAIAGIGTASGTRLVIGMWPRSPYGSVTDVMVERPDGWRILLAPTRELADFIAATYTFDEVRITPVHRGLEGERWGIVCPDLAVTFTLGRRSGLGWLLTAVPRSVARSRWWAGAIDPVARVVQRGVRTRGATSGGRREWYGALDLHRIGEMSATFEGADLGELRPVAPPVRFGFGSTPSAPGLTRVVTSVLLPDD
jgi:hypothetical protein